MNDIKIMMMPHAKISYKQELLLTLTNHFCKTLHWLNTRNVQPYLLFQKKKMINNIMQYCTRIQPYI
jgi:hypothetical protein